MEHLEQTVARNLTELRKAQNWTQAELAEKINYSDKSVSKWERGDGLPDLKVLCQLAELFGVTLDDLVSEHTIFEKKKAQDAAKNERVFRIATEMLAVCTVWLIAVAVFIYTSLNAHGFWMSFVWAVPISFLVLALCSQHWKFRVCSIVFQSILCWTTLATVYLQLLISGTYNLWFLFLIGVPVQATIILWALMRSHKR